MLAIRIERGLEEGDAELSVNQEITIVVSPRDGQADITVVAEPVHVEPDFSPWYGKVAKGISLFFGISTGITGGAALSTLLFGPSFIITAVVLCYFSAYANYRMTHKDIKLMLLTGFSGLFDKKINPSNKLKNVAAQFISHPKKILLSIGIFSAIAMGVTFGALTYMGTLHLVVVFPILAPVSFILPPIGIFLCVMTIASQTFLMTRGFIRIIKPDNLLGNIAQTWKDMFGYDPKRDADKSMLRSVAERVCKALLATVMVGVPLALILYGKICTLGVCDGKLAEALMQIHGASPQIVAIASTIITRGFAFFAQIPFVLTVTFAPVVWLFTPEKKKDPSDKTEAPVTHNRMSFDNILLFVASASSSALMATISMTGKVLDFVVVTGGFGAFLDGFMSNTVNALLGGSEEKEVAEEALPAHQASTLIIHEALEKGGKHRLELITTATPGLEEQDDRSNGLVSSPLLNHTQGSEQSILGYTSETMAPRFG